MSDVLGRTIMLQAIMKGGGKAARLVRRLFEEELTLKDISHIAAELYLLAGETPAGLKRILETRLASDSENEIDRGAYAWLKDNYPEAFGG